MPKNLLQKIQCLLIVCLLVSSSAFSQSAVFDTVMNRINADLHNISSVSVLDSTVGSDISSMTNSDSSWADVNYTTGDGNTHLGRVINFAKAYTTDSSTYFGSSTLLPSIEKALQYWYRKKPVNSNWYLNIISFPTSIGQILILMNYGSPQMSPTVKNNMLIRMNIGAANDSHCQAGSNESDVAVHYVYRAAITQNSTVMDTAFIHAYNAIVYTTGGDGVSYDNCYMAHGGQLGINSYGYSFLSNSFTIPVYLGGTTWALPPAKRDLLTKFYKDTYLKAGRGGYTDWNVTGRGISRGSGLNRDKTIGINTSFLSKAMVVDPANSAIWDSVAAGTWQVKPLHNHYWRGDYDIHQGNGFAFNVHTVSSRTMRTERGNGENLLGKFLPDGATAIQRWGGEYKNIFPVWEWDKIPGVTGRDFSTDAGSAISSDWGVAGTGNFTGGVSDGLYGASVYQMNYNSVTAKKSWFYFKDEVVCLGAGITSTQTENIATTVNQSWLYGDVKISNASTVTTIDSNTNGLTQYSNPQWVLHDSVGYFFPSGGSVNLSNQSQTGSWARINTGLSADALSGKVFKLWLGHGAQPTNSKYVYIVAPGKTSATDMQNYNLTNLRILKNTDSVQALRHLRLDIMQIIFYKAGTLTDSSISITVDKPCVVELKKLHAANVPFYIADPSQQNANITITFQLPGISGTKQLLAVLPQAPYGGSTVNYIIDSTTHIEQTNNPDSLVAVADAFVRDGTYATTNYGSNTGLVVKQDGSSYSRQAYFKFDLHNVTRPLNGARLRLYSMGGNTSANTTQWALYKTTAGSWTEAGLNWNNKPAGTTLVATRQGQVAAGYIEWDITSAVNGLPADSLLSFQLISTVLGGSTDATFYSKETGNSAQRPLIVLDNAQLKTDSTLSTADAYVRDGTYASTNYGTTTGLVVKKDGTGYSRETYLKFNLKGVKGDVQNAKLKVYSGGGNTTANTTKWQVWKGNTNSWTETAINWNNKPSADTLLDSIPGQVAAGYCYWNISNQLKNISSDSTLTLKIVSTILGGNTDVTFYSKETSNASQRPYIVYTTDTSGNYAARIMQKPVLTQAALPVEKIQEEKIIALRIYPNPAVTHCMIQSDEIIKTVTVYNAAGVIVKATGNINNRRHSMNIADLPKGTYFLNVNEQVQRKQAKLLKVE